MYCIRNSNGTSVYCHPVLKKTLLGLSLGAVITLVALSVLSQQNILSFGTYHPIAFYSFLSGTALATFFAIAMASVLLRGKIDKIEQDKILKAEKDKRYKEENKELEVKRDGRDTSKPPNRPPPPIPQTRSLPASPAKPSLEEAKKSQLLQKRQDFFSVTKISLPASKTSVEISSFQVNIKKTKEEVCIKTKEWINQNAERKSKLILDRTFGITLESDQAFRPVQFTKLKFSEAFYHLATFQPLPKQKPSITITPEKYTYTEKEKEHFFIFTANNESFGGKFFNDRFDQEETLVFTFPKLVELAFLFDQGNQLLPCSKGENYPNPEPTIIWNVQRPFETPADFDFLLQQEHLEKFEQEKNAYEPAHSPLIHLVGMAAHDWKKQERHSYQMMDLHYHLQTLLTTFMGIKALKSDAVIHSEQWGKLFNSSYTLTTLQILAAQVAGVTLILHKINSDIFKEATQLIADCKPTEVLQKIIEKQQDSNWRPLGSSQE